MMVVALLVIGLTVLCAIALVRISRSERAR
jgi:hypothetical protein